MYLRNASQVLHNHHRNFSMRKKICKLISIWGNKSNYSKHLTFHTFSFIISGGKWIEALSLVILWLRNACSVCLGHSDTHELDEQYRIKTELIFFQRKPVLTKTVNKGKFWQPSTFASLRYSGTRLCSTVKGRLRFRTPALSEDGLQSFITVVLKGETQSVKLTCCVEEDKSAGCFPAL